jgi:hypothetical protein
VEDILAIAGFNAFLIVAVGGWLLVRWRANELRHQLIRALLEKGQPLTPEVLAALPGSQARAWSAEEAAAAGPSWRWRSDLRKGVLLIAAGIGVALLLFTKDSGQWGVGLFLVALGAGFVVNHALHRGERAGPDRLATRTDAPVR